MTLKENYERLKAKLLNDPCVCKENRDLFAEFFQFEEYKLKRIRGNPALDENSYKTLLSYTSRLRTVNNWFQNHDWRSLTKVDIQRVYDDLEDGKILTHRGQQIRDKRSYYKLIIRGKPFEMAGKKELVREVMQFSPFQASQDVRFIVEAEFRQLVDTVHKTEHRLFLWLCWDIGENAKSVLRLRKRDCIRQRSEHLSEPEYLINLRKEILKRSRRPRSELTNYRETVSYLDLHLQTLGADDLLFTFGQGGAYKLLTKAAKTSGVRCRPDGQSVTLKDLRSSMACDLLSKGWSTDEVNARLGHSPGSREIVKYANYLAIDRSRPKKKFQDNELHKLTVELDEMRDREKLTAYRLDRLQQASNAHITYWQRMAEIQANIVALQIAHTQGKIAEQDFAISLVRLYNALVLHLGQQPKNLAKAAPAVLDKSLILQPNFQN